VTENTYQSIHPRKQTFHKSTVWKVPLLPCLKPNCILLPKVSEKQNYHILRETNYNKTLYVHVHCQDYFPTLVIWIAESWLGGAHTLPDTWTKQVLWCFPNLKYMLQQSLAATVPQNWACYCRHVQNNDKQQNNYHSPAEQTACIVAYLGNSNLFMSHQVANIHHCTTAVICTKQMPRNDKPGSATFFPCFHFIL